LREFDTREGTRLTGKDRERQKKRISRLLTRASRILGRQEIRLLDVGCSSGSLLEIAADLGFSVCGVEPAPKAAMSARSLGFDVRCGFLDQARFPDSSFDLVTLFEVIEHVPEPLPLMREIQRILRPHGLCLLGTGNARSWTSRFLGAEWEYFDMNRHGGHVSFYNPASLRLLAQGSGFEVIDLQTKRVTLADKEKTPRLYFLAKVFQEILAGPVRWLGWGHDMLAVLRKRSDA
jgi:2-polyprenyl-3-methyl-5-hydroxy-6-metoxy-1,4-benzoquinol methylase